MSNLICLCLPPTLVCSIALLVEPMNATADEFSKISLREISDGEEIVESFRLLTYNILADCFVRVPGISFPFTLLQI
jgi:hypothetical protein